MLWLVYILTKTVLLSKYLTWIHIIATILTTVLIATIPTWNNVVGNTMQNGFSFQDVDKYQSENHKAAVIIFIYLASQAVYLFNVVAGLVRRRITSIKEWKGK